MTNPDQQKPPYDADFANVFGLTSNSEPPAVTRVGNPAGFIPVLNGPLTEAVKHDQGKLDWSLLPIDSVEEILKVLEFGKRKYAAWNWASNGGFKYSRLFGSLLRHIFAWWRGEDKDPETGLSHLAHAGCNILFLLYYIKHRDTKYQNNDDRNVWQRLKELKERS